MRNPDRIGPFVAKLAELWADSPDLRFGQVVSMLECYLPKGVDGFTCEDPQWETAMQVAIDQIRFSKGIEK